MVTTEQIAAISRDIERAFESQRIVLLGSYASGEPTEDSDVDLLVVADTALPPPKHYTAAPRVLADYNAAFEIVVRTPLRA